jgi:hypothetical protein
MGRSNLEAKRRRTDSRTASPSASATGLGNRPSESPRQAVSSVRAHHKLGVGQHRRQERSSHAVSSNQELEVTDPWTFQPDRFQQYQHLDQQRSRPRGAPTTSYVQPVQQGQQEPLSGASRSSPAWDAVFGTGQLAEDQLDHLEYFAGQGDEPLVSYDRPDQTTGGVSDIGSLFGSHVDLSPVQPNVLPIAENARGQGVLPGSDPRSSTSSFSRIMRNTAADFQIEDVATWETVSFFITIYLGYLHSLLPIVHRPSFSQAITMRKDKVDRDFRALCLGLGGLGVRHSQRGKC